MSRFLVMSLLLGAVNPLRADQAEWLSQAVAEKAAALIQEGAEVRAYCEPCLDEGYRKIVVKTKEVKPAAQEGFHTLFLNGEAHDLAYIYLKKEMMWTNVAMLVETEVAGVPEFLPWKLKEVAK